MPASAASAARYSCGLRPQTVSPPICITRAGRCRRRSAAAPWSGSACRCGTAPRPGPGVQKDGAIEPSSPWPGTQRPSVFGPTIQDPAARAAWAAQQRVMHRHVFRGDDDARDAGARRAPHPARPPAGCRSPRHRPAPAGPGRRRSSGSPSSTSPPRPSAMPATQLRPGLAHRGDLGGGIAAGRVEHHDATGEAGEERDDHDGGDGAAGGA